MSIMRDGQLECLKEYVKEHNVPEMYSSRLCLEILEFGQERIQVILDHHKQGGIRMGRDELVRIQMNSIY